MAIAINSIGIGKCLIKKFDPESMDFLHWLNNFEYIADFVHIPNDEKTLFLLNVIEPLALSNILLNIDPENPLDLSYEELISHFEELYGFFHGEWAANYRFMLRVQYIDESALHYVHSLNGILRKASHFLIDKLCLMIRFVKGLKDDNIREILRGWNNLTLDKAISIAAQLEYYKLTIQTN